MQFDIFNLNFSVPRNQDASFHAVQTNPSYAGFADATYAITDKLSLTGGLRYTYEDKDFTNLYLNTNLATGAPVLGPILFKAPTKEFYDTSYRGKLTYQFTPDVFTYVSYSKGFKSGGFNAFAVGAQPGYAPERLYSTEVGAKAYLFDRRAYVAGSVYDNQYDNLQVTSGVPTGGVVITNAATAKIKGFELEGELRPIRNLALTGNIAYVDATYDSFPRAPNILGVQVNASGNRLTNAPQWQYYLMATYDLRLNDVWNAQTQLSYRWRDTVYFTPTDQNLPNLRGAPDGELGARINFHNEPLALTVSLYGTNLNDKRVVAGEGITFSYPQAFFNKPRSVGVQIEKKF